MKKFLSSCRLLGWVMAISLGSAAWAQNQTTPPMPAAANPAASAALNTGTNAANPTANPTPNTPATSNNTAPPPDNLDAITKTFTKASEPAKTPANQPPAADPNVNSNNLLPGLPIGNNNGNAPPAETPAQMQQKAFDNALNNVFPLSPEQIQQVMKRMNESQQAGHAPPDPDPTPVVKIEDVQLDPGVAPPLIKVATGYVTTVNILDITGQPWPIQDVVVGGNFQVTGPNDAQVLRLIPQTRFGRGNLSVRLVGLSTPITFRVESGGSEVYYRYDARIPQSGPGAKQSLIDHGFTGEAGDGTLMAVLAGVPPKGAVRLDLSGIDGRTKAWKINGQVYLRTPLTLLSPGWDASVRSADGTSVYVLPETPILMLSDNGQMVRSRVDIPPEDPFHPAALQEGKITVPVTPTTPATNPLAPPLVTNGPPVTANQVAAAAVAPTTAAAQSTTNNNSNVTKLPGGVTIYSGGSTPPVQARTNIPVNVNIGGSGL